MSWGERENGGSDSSVRSLEFNSQRRVGCKLENHVSVCFWSAVRRVAGLVVQVSLGDYLAMAVRRIMEFVKL
jgi:hypothetical protein